MRGAGNSSAKEGAVNRRQRQGPHQQMKRAAAADVFAILRGEVWRLATATAPILHWRLGVVDDDVVSHTAESLSHLAVAAAVAECETEAMLEEAMAEWDTPSTPAAATTEVKRYDY